MMDLQWMKWITDASDPAARATMVVLGLIVVGLVLVGVVTGKRRQAVRGGIVFGALGLLIVLFGADVKELIRFETLASKVLLGVLIGVVSGLIVRAIAGK